MFAIEVYRNDVLLSRAGIENGSMISPSLGAFVGGDQPSWLHISGMCDLSDDRAAHVHWLDETPIASGDRITISLVKTEDPSAPYATQATDDEEYLKEQHWFEEIDRNYVPPTERANRRWPALTYECAINGKMVVRAAYALAEEHLLCTALWDKWQPDCMRIFLRSFHGAADGGTHRQTQWLRANLSVGEYLEITVYA